MKPAQLNATQPKGTQPKATQSNAEQHKITFESDITQMGVTGYLPDCATTVIHEEVVARVRKAMVEDKHFYNLANLFKMFADNTRLRILWALSHEDMCVCDLAALLGMTKSAISHQLKSLRLANLVKYVKQGKVVYYSLVDCHAKEIFRKGFEHIME